MPRSSPSQAPPAPGLTVEVVPVESLHLDSANVRRHDRRSIDAIKASLARFDQQRPILVDGDNIVRAGNGTLEAARELGWETIQIVRTALTGSEAIAYAISDNRTAELSDWSEAALATVLEGLQDDGVDLGDIGFSDEDLSALLNGDGDHPSSPDDAAPPADFGSYDEDIETAYRCPKCSYEWSGKPK